MGRLSRLARPARLSAAALVAAGALVSPARVAAFDEFGELDASATFGEVLRFEVEFSGGPPDELELLLRFAHDEVTFVQPVEPGRDDATHVWDLEENYIGPNTPIHYRWRATTGETVVESDEETILYDDDRVDWQIAESEEARVHWYSDDDELAERFLSITSSAVQRAETLFGAELIGPVDIFAYESEQDFFGALDLGPREWVGGQASSEIRTIYLRLDAGGEDYMEPLLIHEVAHIVFDDATDNPYHGPAHWLNEGLAVWAETQDAADARAAVERAAADGDLMAFDAIEEQFPVEDARARLAYAQSAALVDHIIDTYGSDAIARLTAAYRDGATDSAAIEAGTGVPLQEIEDEWFAALGQEVPQPVEPEPLLPAEPEVPGSTSQPDRPDATDRPDGTAPPAGASGQSAGALPWIAGGAILLVGIAIIAGVGIAAVRQSDQPARGGGAGGNR